MRFIKYICILSFCFPTLVFSGESVGVCSVSFSSHTEFIKSFFSDPNNIKQYQGQVGYIRFVEEHLSFLQMDTVFSYTSKILSKEDIGILNWQNYQGSTKEFRQERSNILDETGNVKEEYQGSKGYARYADEFYLEKMQQTYINVSAVLSESEKKSLNWQSYQGNTKEFREERFQILDEIGNVKEEYQGSKGYARYADEFYLGKMQKAYQNISTVLSESEKKSLNWQQYQGNTKEFREERSRILDEQGNIKKEYQGQFGYARYADEFYDGKMQTTYQNVSAVLSESEKKNLNWQQYYGSTKEFRQERSQILDEKGNIKKEYRDQKGYVRYSDEFYIGKMQKAYQNVSAVLSESEKRSLNWQVYQGNTKEFREERSRILNKTRNIKKEYQGLKGYARYADEFYLGKMQKAYQNISTVLSESEKKSLNWQQYKGNTKEFREERSRVLDKTGNVKKEYQSKAGYARYADEFYLGKMQQTHINVSAVLSESEKKSLNWQFYQGNTKEFIGERSRILDEKGNIKKEYQGPIGYARYADEFYVGKMQKAYKNVSAVLSESEKKSLNWQQYQGNIKEFRGERSRILDEIGNIKKEYQGLKGYARYTDEFYVGKMQKAYQNVSAVLSKEDMKDLSWKQFKGDTGQFQSLFEFFQNHSFEDYQGPVGQKKIAKMIFKNHLTSTYMNISVLRDYLFSHKDEFKDLRESGWSLTLSW